MPEAQSGDTVKVHFTGKLKDGTVIDSSREREPLEIKIGEGRFIPGFEEAIVGMEPGSEKTAEVKAENAFGEFRNELVMEIPRTEFQSGVDLEVGQKFKANDPQRGSVVVTIVDLNEETATIDANHELAGKDLVFDIELLEIV